MRKRLLLGLAVAALVLLAGCNQADNPKKPSKTVTDFDLSEYFFLPGAGKIEKDNLIPPS